MVNLSNVLNELFRLRLYASRISADLDQP